MQADVFLYHKELFLRNIKLGFIGKFQNNVFSGPFRSFEPGYADEPADPVSGMNDDIAFFKRISDIVKDLQRGYVPADALRRIFFKNINLERAKKGLSSEVLKIFFKSFMEYSSGEVRIRLISEGSSFKLLERVPATLWLGT